MVSRSVRRDSLFLIGEREPWGRVVSKRRLASSVEAPAVETSPRRRLPRKTREEVIVAAASALFAEAGFDAPTRELARRASPRPCSIGISYRSNF